MKLSWHSVKSLHIFEREDCLCYIILQDDCLRKEGTPWLDDNSFPLAGQKACLSNPPNCWIPILIIIIISACYSDHRHQRHLFKRPDEGDLSNVFGRELVGLLVCLPYYSELVGLLVWWACEEKKLEPETTCQYRHRCLAWLIRPQQMLSINQPCNQQQWDTQVFFIQWHCQGTYERLQMAAVVWEWGVNSCSDRQLTHLHSTPISPLFLYGAHVKARRGDSQVPWDWPLNHFLAFRTFTVGLGGCSCICFFELFIYILKARRVEFKAPGTDPAQPKESPRSVSTRVNVSYSIKTRTSRKLGTLQLFTSANLF